MRKNKPFQKNSMAIAMIYDTLLFLTFISLSGIILIPAFIPQNQFSSSDHIHHDQFVEETLNQMLKSSVKEFNYTIAGDMIDSYAESIGINTSHSTGIYQSLTHWILGKQQYHKTYGEHLGDLLFCNLEIPIYQNETITFNVLTKDYENRINSMIEKYLNSQIDHQFQYHFQAIWRPIRNINIGGTVEIGTPAPMITNSYTATQTINIPLLPILFIDDSIVIITKQWVKNEIKDILDQNVIFDNISDNLDYLKNINENHDEYNHYLSCQRENITSLTIDLICDGLTDQNNTIIFPGFISLIIDMYFSKLLSEGEILDNMNYSFNSGIDQFDNLLFNKINSDSNTFQNQVIKFIAEHLAGYAINTSININDFLSIITKKVTSTIKSHITPIISSLIFESLPIEILKNDIDNLIDELIKLIFSQLSLTRASVTLTIWEGRID